MKWQRTTVLACGLWLATIACLTAGLVVTLAVVSPLTLTVLAAGAVEALALSLGFATIGLVVAIHRPANPIGWLYGAAGLASCLTTPLAPWVGQLLREHRPLPLVAQLNAVTGIVLVLVAGHLAPGRLESVPVDKPFGLSGAAGTAASVAMTIGVVLHWASLVAALRYRMWDLDRLVSRTVTYTLVTALLVVPYLLVVPAAGRLAAGSGSLAVATATLAAAAAFQPLRRRVQRSVDRRFNRRRYDAAGTAAGFAARLRDQVDLDALSADLLAVIDQTMQPTQTQLWLRPPALPRPR